MDCQRPMRSLVSETTLVRATHLPTVWPLPKYVANPQYKTMMMMFPTSWKSQTM